MITFQTLRNITVSNKYIIFIDNKKSYKKFKKTLEKHWKKSVKYAISRETVKKSVFYNLAFVIHSTEFRKNSTSIYFYDIFRYS